MALWAVQFGGFLFVIGAVAYLAYNLGYQVRKDEEQQLVKELSQLIFRLELASDDAKYQSELTGAYVKDAIAKLELALGHVDDER